KLNLEEDYQALAHLMGININLLSELGTWFTFIQHPTIQQLLRQYIHESLQIPLEILRMTMDRILSDMLPVLGELQIQKLDSADPFQPSIMEDILPLTSFQQLLSQIIGPDLLPTLSDEKIAPLAKQLVSDLLKSASYLDTLESAIDIQQVLYEVKYHMGRTVYDRLKQSRAHEDKEHLEVQFLELMAVSNKSSLQLQLVYLIIEFEWLYEEMILPQKVWTAFPPQYTRAIYEKSQSYTELMGIHGEDPTEVFENYHRSFLLKVADDFINVVEIFREFARERLAPEFITSDHAPQMGLLFSFLELWEKNHQPAYNLIPYQHGKFYFEKVLRLRKRSARPDYAYIAFELVPGSLGVKIPAQTLLATAPGTDGVIHHFSTSKDQYINNGKVASLKTLHIEGKAKNQLQVDRTIYAASQANSLDGQGLPFPNPAEGSWYPFGKNQGNIADSKRFMQPARIGFVLGSPQLLMLGGETKVKLTFYLKDQEV
ncbi:MAG: hypothetical protein AAFR59_14060, partial [Bacteroidota bacterium]